MERKDDGMHAIHSFIYPRSSGACAATSSRYSLEVDKTVTYIALKRG